MEVPRSAAERTRTASPDQGRSAGGTTRAGSGAETRDETTPTTAIRIMDSIAGLRSATGGIAWYGVLTGAMGFACRVWSGSITEDVYRNSLIAKRSSKGRPFLFYTTKTLSNLLRTNIRIS